jgi:hypothetical protein
MIAPSLDNQDRQNKTTKKIRRAEEEVVNRRDLKKTPSKKTASSCR